MTIFDLFSSESQFTDGLDPSDPANANLLRSIQGNILKAHGRDLASHVFVTFTCAPALARAWLAREGALCTTAARQQEEGDARREAIDKGAALMGTTFRNVCVSADGYRSLAMPPERFESTFRKGMKSRDGLLMNLAKTIVNIENKDPEPSTWQRGFQAQVHAMVMLADDDDARLAAATSAIVDSLHGLATTFVERGARLTFDGTPKGKDIEHFGYRDGISQPLFFADEIQKKRGQHYDPSAPKELVLTRDPYGSGPDAFGSYLVFRKLAQDVARFNQEVLALSAKVNGGDAELTGAQVVGRFKDGTPVTRFQKPQGISGDVNDFNYEATAPLNEDDGQRCPLHAHIRKANPRNNTPLTSHESERSRRIARRGIPYGRPGDAEVGLLFLCFQQDIGHQFEFIQRVWVDNSRFPQLLRGTGDDPLIGQDETHAEQRWRVHYGSAKPTVDFDFRAFVSLQGGEYFFAPSMSFFETLA